MTKPLAQGAVIGILGGGQLGRMLAVAASRLGFKVCVFEPGGDCPASHVANYHFQADYDDHAALRKFADSVDVITYEFENIPTDALDLLERHRMVLPARNALATSQDRIVEKDFLSDIGLTCAPYANVETADDLASAVGRIGAPSILKTRRFGYDGKGQARLRAADDAVTSWDTLGNTPCVLEGFVDFSCEISVIGARSMSGQVVCFDPGENIHQNGILHTTSVPAQVPASVKQDAILAAGKILNALDYVGVIGVEFFVTPEGLIVNEIAPRVHNSGHWTQNGCVIDQFEQHIRAVAGWPLGDGARHSDVVMENLLGDAVLDVDRLSADSSIGLHLYGKADAKPGRKMGHFNRILGARSG
ncbi:MAG: 5-(carboxyamino)imidazole ribonucleotide synthase [Pseudomonadota bacterium]